MAFHFILLSWLFMRERLLREIEINPLPRRGQHPVVGVPRLARGISAYPKPPLSGRRPNNPTFGPPGLG
jgi:hypothetical protein